MSYALELIANGVKAVVRGQDLGASLAPPLASETAMSIFQDKVDRLAVIPSASRAVRQIVADDPGEWSELPATGIVACIGKHRKKREDLQGEIERLVPSHYLEMCTCLPFDAARRRPQVPLSRKRAAL